MLKSLKFAALAALPALALATSPVEARDGYYRGYHGYHRGGDDAAIAIGAGVVGLALGAAIASNHDRDYYYDDDFYYPGGYYGYPRYYSYSYGYPVYVHRGWSGYRGGYYGGYRGGGNYRGDWHHQGGWSHGGHHWGH